MCLRIEIKVPLVNPAAAVTAKVAGAKIDKEAPRIRTPRYKINDSLFSKMAFK